MKQKILLALLILLSLVRAEKTLLILPYCSKNVSNEEANHLLVATRRIMFESDEYSPAFSFDTERMIFEKTNFDNCEYFLHTEGAEKFNQVVYSTNVDVILSCAVNKKNEEYGLFFKLKDPKTGAIIKSKGYGSSSELEKLVNHELKKMLYNFFDVKDHRSKYLSLSLSGGYLDNYSDFTAGARLGFGSVKWGEIALETNLYTETLAENITLTYTTPMKYFLYLKLGVGFTSERKNGFSLTDYHGAPNIDKIEELEHSAGALGAIGISLPLSHYFRLNIAAETDAVFARWKYWDGKEKEAVIYSYYPEIEISYLFRF